MQTVSPTYHAKAISQVRKVDQAVLVDWFDENNFIDETPFIERIEVERSLEEPLGGVAVALADIIVINTKDRFTPL